MKQRQPGRWNSAEERRTRSPRSLAPTPCEWAATYFALLAHGQTIAAT